MVCFISRIRKFHMHPAESHYRFDIFYDHPDTCLMILFSKGMKLKILQLLQTSPVRTHFSFGAVKKAVIRPPKNTHEDVKRYKKGAVIIRTIRVLGGSFCTTMLTV